MANLEAEKHLLSEEIKKLNNEEQKALTDIMTNFDKEELEFQKRQINDLDNISISSLKESATESIESPMLVGLIRVVNSVFETHSSLDTMKVTFALGVFMAIIIEMVFMALIRVYLWLEPRPTEPLEQKQSVDNITPLQSNSVEGMGDLKSLAS